MKKWDQCPPLILHGFDALACTRLCNVLCLMLRNALLAAEEEMMWNAHDIFLLGFALLNGEETNHSELFL